MTVGLLRSRASHALRALSLVAALAVAAIAAGVMITPALIAALPLAIIIGVFLAITRIFSAKPVIERGALAVRDGAVMVGNHAIAARDAITSGTVIPGAAEGVVVRLDRGHGAATELQVESVEAGRALLEKLGLDPAHAVARFPLLASDPRTWRRRMFFTLGTIFSLVALNFAVALAGLPFLIPLFIPFVILGALLMVFPSRAAVGTDGISVRRFGREEFISLDGIADAVVAEGDRVFGAELAVVRLLDRDGAIVRELVVDQKKMGPFSEGIHAAIDARARALAQRINEVIALRHARDAAFDPATLARGDRPLDAWIRELRTYLTRATGFRDAQAPSHDALLAIVEDASASPIDRVAAAIVVGPRERERVRIAASATAEAHLRVALEASLDDDEQKLASALEEIERVREA